MNRNSERIAIALIIVGVLAGIRQPAIGIGADDDALQLIVTGTREAVYAIKSGKGNLTEHQWAWRSDGSAVEAETEYTVAFSGSAFKLVAHRTYIKNEPQVGLSEERKKLLFEPGEARDFAFAFDGQTAMLYEPSSELTGRAVKGSKDSQTLVGNQLRSLSRLVSLNGHGFYAIDAPMPDSSVQDLSDSGPVIKGREVLDGDECVIVERVQKFKLTDGEQAVRTFLYWVNPSKGYSIPKAQRWIEGGIYKEKTLIREELTAFRMYQGGLWGPARWTMTQYTLDTSSGKARKSHQIDIKYSSDFQLNPSLTQADLTLTLPSGTKVYDEDIDAQYTVP